MAPRRIAVFMKTLMAGSGGEVKFKCPKNKIGSKAKKLQK
jgi:hypothetical protein